MTRTLHRIFGIRDLDYAFFISLLACAVSSFLVPHNAVPYLFGVSYLILKLRSGKDGLRLSVIGAWFGLMAWVYPLHQLLSASVQIELRSLGTDLFVLCIWLIVVFLFNQLYLEMRLSRRIIQQDLAKELPSIQPSTQEDDSSEYNRIGLIAKELVSSIEWKTLIRNAQDGGANSVLACHILKKTAELLINGSSQVNLMLEAANAVRGNTQQLREISAEIKQISAQTTILSLNASIEAARAGVFGKAFGVVTTEMKSLASTVEQMTRTIDQRLGDVNDKIATNDNLCKTVSKLFVGIDLELKQFRNLMLRVEELATIQAKQLKKIENQLM